MAYSVSERRQEIGIRMALGAEVPHLMKMVLKQAGVLASGGIVLGLVFSFWLTKYISYLLFEITPTDPITYATVTVLLLGVALIAAYVPARRVMALEPMMALRGESSTVAAVYDRRFFAAVEEKPAVIDRRYSETQSEPIIEVRDLHKVFETIRGKSTPALSGVSLAVEPGTIFGLIGQNGAGKTTLVKILMGLCEPTSGYARLLGCFPGEPVAQRRIGYLPESMRIPVHFMPENFLRYMGRLNGVDSHLLKERIPELLEKVGLAGARKPVKSFSKGMQQRLGIAQALINDPEVLFLDEPTDGLDPLGRIEVRDLLAQLRDAGKTIFLNSHLLSEVELVCDQIVILDKGVVARTTTPAEFTRGTGEYLVRVQTVDDIVRRAAESVVGPAAWQGDGFRFTPRDVAQLNDLLDALRRVPVPIVAVEPLKVSLEQFFIQVVTTKMGS
jgi:ABC-2 type transport system ATP-binding protein